MAQTWQLGVQAVRPGTYFRVSSGDVTTVGAVNGIVAVIMQTNWGPTNEVVDIDQSQLNNLRELFGTGTGVTAIKQALLGGATQVKAIRVGDETANANGRFWVDLAEKTVNVSGTYKVGTGNVVEIKDEKFLTDGTDTNWRVTSGPDLTAGTDYSIDAFFQPTVTMTDDGLKKLNSDGTIYLIKSYSLNGQSKRVAKVFPVGADGKVVVTDEEYLTAGTNTTWEIRSNFQVLTANEDYTISEFGSLKVTLTAAGAAKLNSEKTIWVRKRYTQPKSHALRVYLAYDGDFPFTYSIKTNLVTGKRQFIMYDGGQIYDAVEFDSGGDEAQKLMDELKTKKYIGAVTKKDAGKLADVVNKICTPGANPHAGMAAYQKGLDILERYYWNVVVADRAWEPLQALLASFVKTSYDTGHLGMTVFAGNIGTALSERLSYAKTLNDWRVVYLLSGWLGNDGVKYQDWPAAARIAGMIAACETNASLTHITIDNAQKLLEDLSNGEMIRAEESGCLVLSYNESDQVWIDNAINTLITLGNDMDEGWKKIRRTKCRFELMTRINRTCDRLIGRLNNDENGRATLVSAMQGIINEMIAEGKLFGGSYVTEDDRYKPVGDRAYFVLYIGDIDSVEKIYLDFNFSYANPFA